MLSGGSVEHEGLPSYPWEAVGLLERGGQIETLVAQLELAREAGRLVLVEGDAGVGKTTLVQELCRAPRRQRPGAVRPVR